MGTGVVKITFINHASDKLIIVWDTGNRKSLRESTILSAIIRKRKFNFFHRKTDYSPAHNK